MLWIWHPCSLNKISVFVCGALNNLAQHWELYFDINTLLRSAKPGEAAFATIFPPLPCLWFVSADSWSLRRLPCPPDHGLFSPAPAPDVLWAPGGSGWLMCVATVSHGPVCLGRGAQGDWAAAPAARPRTLGPGQRAATRWRHPWRPRPGSNTGLYAAQNAQEKEAYSAELIKNETFVDIFQWPSIEFYGELRMHSNKKQTDSSNRILSTYA